MLKPCLDCYHTNFNAFPDMLAYHEQLRQDSHWERSEVQNLTVAALDKTSPLFADDTLFDASVSKEAIVDTAENLGLAIQIGGQFYPLRDTSYRSLLDRAKINGTALPKLSREKLARCSLSGMRRCPPSTPAMRRTIPSWRSTSS